MHISYIPLFFPFLGSYGCRRGLKSTKNGQVWRLFLVLFQMLKSTGLELTWTRFKTSTFRLLLLKIVVKMTFLSNAIRVLKICLLTLFAMLLLMLLYYFLVQVETNFSISTVEKVYQISLLFHPFPFAEICFYSYFLLCFCLYFCSTALLLLLFESFLLLILLTKVAWKIE